ncbi:MAG TPA: ABC transporter ATP-binding protein [Steroidobacteraceae bacterium]
MIELKSLSKVFRTDIVETYALRDFDLKIAAGEFVAITGHSGSGKTTLLNVAGLLEEFEGGSYRLDGEDVKALSDNQRSHIRNRKIGFVFQGFNLIPNLNIYDNVDAPLQYRRMPAAERRKRIMHSLEQVGLTSRMRHFPAQLSGGQQQRAAIARAIGGEPQVILADEPTGNLDTTMSAQIMDLLQSINRAGTTILMVTHNEELARRANRIVHMVDGHIATDQSDRFAEIDRTAAAAPN